MTTTRLVDSFEAGHLLFGVKELRDQIIPRLKDKVRQPVIVDTYLTVLNQVTFDEDEEEENKDHIHGLYSEAKELAFRKSIKFYADSKARTTETLLIDHLERIKEVKGYPKLSVTNNEFKPHAVLSIPQRKIRRVCKARLINTSMVHFILSDINLQHVCDKVFSGKHSNIELDSAKMSIYDSFTSSEIRFVLKHYSELLPHIRFYIKKESDFISYNFLEWLQNQTPLGQKALIEWASSLGDKVDTQVRVCIEQIKLKLATLTVEKFKELSETDPFYTFDRPPRKPGIQYVTSSGQDSAASWADSSSFSLHPSTSEVIEEQIVSDDEMLEEPSKSHGSPSASLDNMHPVVSDILPPFSASSVTASAASESKKPSLGHGLSLFVLPSTEIASDNLSLSTTASSVAKKSPPALFSLGGSALSVVTKKTCESPRP